nr:MAG TPA: hypothetical protein [Caudoviricetes sp.]
MRVGLVLPLWGCGVSHGPFLRVQLAQSVSRTVVLRCSMVHVGHFQHTFC